MQEIVYKICSDCKKEKSLDEFWFQRGGKYQRSSWCKKCWSEKQRIYNKSDIRIKARRKNHLANSYGLTQEEYDQLLKEQGGVCAICNQENISGHPLCIDHKDNPLLVRGLLCHHCNRLIGLAKESPEILRSAVDYLEKSQRIQKLMELIA